MIQLSEKHQNILRDILRKQLKGQKVYVFGSRATNKAQKFSDVDLCIDGPELSFGEEVAIKDAFSESDLPYFVDVVQKSRLSDEFYQLVKNDFIQFPLG
ncbi:MAG: putative nucleotidyltransferase [Lentisphaeria bacterium]|jgi:predicted nucleotidyltransferase